MRQTKLLLPMAFEALKKFIKKDVLFLSIRRLVGWGARLRARLRGLLAHKTV